MPRPPTPLDVDGRLGDRLDRLGGLPLRPMTAVRIATSGPGPGPSDDPGWALAVAALGPKAARACLADAPWWPSVERRADAARDRLWRFAVAIAVAARRLARDAGLRDPDALGRLGLLQPIAPWALAVVDPRRLGCWMDAPDSASRRSLERDWFGAEMAEVGRRLAFRWGAGPDLAEAAWHAGRDDQMLGGPGHDPGPLALIQRARRWALRTPWAPDSERRPGPLDIGSRWLIAEVQVRCGSGLAEPVDLEESVRAAARSALRGDRHAEEAAALAVRLEAAIEALDSVPVVDRHAPAFLDALAEFAAGAAHELNNPLAIIAGRAQLLRNRLDDPEGRRALGTILAQSRRAHQILRDLIYIARPPRPRAVPCVPDQVLRSVVEDLSGMARARRVALTCRTTDRPIAATADPEGLRHLADALIRNALEATPAGGHVAVRSNGDAGTLRWSVSDDGIGLEPEAAEHLLDPFYCGRQAGRGLGLGLPRVDRFLRSAGGALRWESVPGGGTVVLVELPLGIARADDALAG